MDTKTHYTKIEVEELLEKLNKADISRLLQIFNAQGALARTGLSAEDVLQNAISQVLAVDRPWPNGITTVAYFAASGRSFISNESDKRKKMARNTLDELEISTDQNHELRNAASKTYQPSLDHEIDKNHSSNLVNEWIEKIYQLFADDKEASCYLKQKLAEKKKAIILTICEFTDKIYRNVEKRIKDKARKRFPKGIPWWEIGS